MMKRIVNNTIKIMTAIMVSGLLAVSCEYDEYAEADYPAQKIYMPTATAGVYDVSVVPSTSAVPTPGKPYRYQIVGDKFNVPLAAYRSGVDNDGDISVNIVANADTVSKMLAAAQLNAGTLVLPANQFTLPSSVIIPDGGEVGKFTLSVDLAYLKSNPNTKFAIGVSVECTSRVVNPLLKTTIVLIDSNLANLPN